jgi:hypothetical protein
VVLNPIFSHVVATLSDTDRPPSNRRARRRTLLPDAKLYIASIDMGSRHGGLMDLPMQIVKRFETMPLTRDFEAARNGRVRSADAAR